MESLKEEPSGSLKKEKYRGESEGRHAANRLKKCAVEDLNEYSCEELEEMRMRA